MTTPAPELLTRLIPPRRRPVARRSRRAFRRAWRSGLAVGLFTCYASTLLLRATAAEPVPRVSYFNDLVPLFKRSCTGCHHPGKLKGELDLTSYASFQKGGKHGPAFKAGDPAGSLILDEIRAPDPSMPKEGDPLTSQEVELFERWIQEGAPDDTPPEALSFQPKEPPVYAAPAVVSALAFSPDGQLLAISGRHEVFLFDAAELRLLDRLLGEAPRIESLCFSPDGTFLALAGGAPARFGEVQIWDLATRKAAKTWRISADSLYGLSVSPDSARVAFGAADRLVRVLAVADGKELVRFDNHSDWVLGTLFTVDGRRLLSGSRDQAMKLIDAATGQFIDDINKHFEGVLCMARHPREDVVAYGGDQGTPRIYRISDNQNRTAANNDVNQLRELERQPGPVYAIAYSPDASVLAVAAAGGQVQLYRTADGARARTLPGHSGPVFSLAFHPKQPRLATGGFDGLVRVFDFPSGELVAVFTPVEIEPGAGVVAAR